MIHPPPVTLIGHDEQKETLRTLRAHTLLFYGPEGVGRRQVARWYAALLNCVKDGDEACGKCESCRLFAAESHPDYREVAPNLLTTTGKRSRRPEIRIAQLVPRKGEEDNPLSRWLETPPRFKRRLGVIDSAHLMNVSAANSFLKMLEEPPAHAVIVLIAPSPQAVLPTIASRSAPLRFGTLALQNESHPVARLGRLGDLRRAEAEPDTFAEVAEVVQQYVNALPKGLEEALEATDAFEKTWSSNPPFDLPDLLSAHFSDLPPVKYSGAQAALVRFQEALEAYAAPGLAAQVLTLELRKVLKSKE